jgi:hypothetical protein
MSVLPYGSLYFGSDANGEAGAPSGDIVAQVNYEADLVNRILALGLTTEAEADAVGSLLFAKIQGMHDRAEQDRVLDALGRLKNEYNFLPATREQVDYLVDQLRVNDWNVLDGDAILAVMQEIGSQQAAGTLPEVDAYGVMGQDVRPILAQIWSQPNHPFYKQALELAKRIDLVRQLRYARALNLATGKESKPALAEDIETNKDRAHQLSIEMGLEKDTHYTLGMLEISEYEFEDLIVDPKAALEKDPKAKEKSEQAEKILASGDSALDAAVDQFTVKETRDRWLVGGAFLLGLLYIFSRPRA